MEKPKQDGLKEAHIRHMMIKMAKVKDKKRILKATHTHTKLVTHNGAPIRLSVDFSTEIFQARRNLYEIIKVMKGKDLQPKLLYTARLSFKLKEK